MLHKACSSLMAIPLSISSFASLFSVNFTRYSPLDSCCRTVILSAPISAVIASLISFREAVTGVPKITDRPFRSAMIAKTWALKMRLTDRCSRLKLSGETHGGIRR